MPVVPDIDDGRSGVLAESDEYPGFVGITREIYFQSDSNGALPLAPP